MTVKEFYSSSGICEVLHFTTNRGVVGTLASGFLKSRRLLREEDYLQHILRVNSASRPEESLYFDKSQDWLNFVNLSISEINRRFFEFFLTWHPKEDVWWAILSFDAELMEHSGVWFATTNNGYEHCIRLQEVGGLSRCFEKKIARKGTWTAWRGGRPAHLPTCEQAEVLYPEQVSINFLRKVYVQRGEDQDRVRGWIREFAASYPTLNDVEVVLAPAKFLGKKN